MVIWGLECWRLIALGLGWLEALPWRPPTLPAQFSRSASGSAIRCHSSFSCAGAHDSGFVGRASSMWLLGEFGILLFCSPGFWDVGGLLRALSSPGG